MAQENTAVNRLIELGGGKPVDINGEFDNLFVDPATRAAKRAQVEAEARAKAESEMRARVEAEVRAKAEAKARAEAQAAVAAASRPSRQTMLGQPVHKPPPPFRPSSQMAAQGTPAPELVRASAKMAAQAVNVDFSDDEGTPLPPPMPHPDTAPSPQSSEPRLLVAPALIVNKLPPAPMAPPRARSKSLHGVTPAQPQLAITADEDRWFDPSTVMEKQDELLVGTQDVPKLGGGQTKWWIIGAFALGIGVAALLFWPTGSRSAKDAPGSASSTAQTTPTAAKTPATTAKPPVPAIEALPAAAAAPTATTDTAAAPATTVAAAAPATTTAAAAAPAVTTPATTAAAPVAAPGQVVVRFESVPPGANVVLVEDGATTPLGASPVEHAIDPTHHIEAMFSLEGHASVILPVDPASKTISATLASSAAAAPAVAVAVAPAPTPAPAPTTETLTPAPTKVAASAPKKKEHAAARVVPAAKEKHTKVAAASSDGEGVLMIASKPPCSILVDGKNTGKSTPQRDLALPAGKHKITLVNADNDIKESFSVTIKASESVRVIKDLTAKMK